jgi:hypothetical protein
LTDAASNEYSSSPATSARASRWPALAWRHTSAISRTRPRINPRMRSAAKATMSTVSTATISVTAQSSVSEPDPFALVIWLMQ